MTVEERVSEGKKTSAFWFTLLAVGLAVVATVGLLLKFGTPGNPWLHNTIHASPSPR